jgi:hypothetical protein
LNNLLEKAAAGLAWRKQRLGVRLVARLAQGQAAGTAAHGKMSIGEKLRSFQIGHLSHAASVAVLTAGLGAFAAGSRPIPQNGIRFVRTTSAETISDELQDSQAENAG